MSTPIVASKTDYEYLESRPGSFYRELFVRGANLRASRLVSWMVAESLSPEQAAADRDLSTQAVLEAIHYVENHREFLAEELDREHQMLRDRGLLEQDDP